MSLLERGFSLSSVCMPGRVVVKVTGELDGATAPELRSLVADLVGEGGDLDVVIDVSEMSFIDSKGLVALVGAATRLEQRGGRLSLCAPSRRAMKVFEAAGLAELVTITA